MELMTLFSVVVESEGGDDDNDSDDDAFGIGHRRVDLIIIQIYQGKV